MAKAKVKAKAKKPVAKKQPALKKKPATKKPAKKKPAAKKPVVKKKPPPKKPAASGPPKLHVPKGAARQRLRDALAWVDDFVADCRRRASEMGTARWPVADTPELVGLERWATELATTDREAGVCALVLAAQYGLPRILAAGGSELDGMGYRGDEMLDGASVESQLDRCARWVDNPSAANVQAVEDGFDRTRQMHTWDPDLQPHDLKSYFWYSEIGQLASAAIVKGEGDTTRNSYFYWPAAVCAGRGLVIAARGLRGEGADIVEIIRELYGAMTA